jgi:nucleotide-binding universal stress UspA family protein
MLRSILIGLDGSADGDAALGLGLRWAKRYDAVAAGIAVADEPGVYASEAALFAEAYTRPAADTLVQREHRRAARALRRFALCCEAEGVRYKLIEGSGSPRSQILTEAQRFDLVVLGRRTHFAYGCDESPDDTLSSVLKESPRPVVVAPHDPAEGEAAVVAFDGSLQASRALYAFEASGLARLRTVHVLSVAAEAEGATRIADRAIEFLRAHEIVARAVPVATKLDTAGVILARARDLNAGLLVMGAYGKPGLREFFLGSVTREVLEEGRIPTFFFH